MFVLKLYYNNEIRRIALSEKVSFSALTNLVKELFSSSKLLGNFVLKYLDNEEDVITVASDQELSEAFRLAQEIKPSIIKFQVVPVASPVQPSSQKDCCNTRRPSCGFGYGRGFPHPAVCDSCNKRIFGLRFKCLNCPDYDLCSECTTIEGVHDKEHVFLKVHPSAYFAEQCFKNRWNECCSSQRNEEPEKEEVDEEDESDIEDDETNEEEEKKGSEGKQEEVKEETPKVTITPSSSVQPPVPSAPTPELSVPLSPAPSTELSSFKLKLKQLEEMGFSEKEKNIAALLKNNGNLVQTVKDLIDV